MKMRRGAQSCRLLTRPPRRQTRRQETPNEETPNEETPNEETPNEETPNGDPQRPTDPLEQASQDEDRRRQSAVKSLSELYQERRLIGLVCVSKGLFCTSFYRVGTARPVEAHTRPFLCVSQRD
jgi:hypothetical protein